MQFIASVLTRRSSGRLTGLLLARIDAYNRIGATFGEAHSQQFCRDYANQLRELLPAGTPVIRLSERRFAILLATDSITAVMDIAHRLAEEHAPKIRRGTDAFLVDMTLGAAVYPTHADDAQSLFRRSELALNQAASRAVSFEMYRPETTQRQAALWKFASDLDHAIKEGGIEIHMQPKVRVLDGRVVGAEALARWRHKSGRLVLPGDFVPIAERTGSIVPLTWLVFDKVAAHAAAWGELGSGFKVAINVSASVLDHTDFTARLDALQRQLQRSGVGLIVELTEESLVSDYHSALARLHRIRQAGADLAIDDFGKGYSSLGYLKDVPATEIKIDKSFVATAARDAKDWHIIKATTELAHAFGMSVVGEGVDSIEALQVLRELGCECAQGYYFARPMRAELLGEWCSANGGDDIGGMAALELLEA